MDITPTEPDISPENRPVPPAGRGRIFPGWVWLSGIFLAAVLLAVAWVDFLFAPMPPPSQQALPLFTVYPAPTLSEVPPTPTWTPEGSPTPVESGMIALGMLVEVSGTGGDGLNLREAPNTSGTVLFRVFEHEVFRVVNGPQKSNDHTWWLLQGAIDANRQGWGVENYLRPSGT